MAKSIISSKKTIFSIKKVKNQKKWKKEEDILLVRLAKKYNERNWKEIASNFANKNPLQCFSRYKRIRPGIKKGTWKKDEDAKIMELVRKYGTSWSKISKEIKTRNGKQIRDRYLNVLDPNIKKDKFTHEEDVFLIQLFNVHGPKWALISKNFPNRTADMIKNRFHSSIKKRLDENDTSLPQLLLSEEACKEIAISAPISHTSTIDHSDSSFHEVSSLSMFAMEDDFEEQKENHLFDLKFFGDDNDRMEEETNDFNWALDLSC